jgi:hypothetical protein
LGEQAGGGQFDADEGLRLWPGGVRAASYDVVERGGAVCIAGSFARDEVLGAIAEDGDVEVEAAGHLTTGEWFSGRDVLRINGR